MGFGIENGEFGIEVCEWGAVGNCERLGIVSGWAIVGNER